MKTASVRDLRQDFARILAWLQAGEAVSVTMRRVAIATLVPLPRRKRVPGPRADLTARLRRVFGAEVIPDAAMKALVDQDRGRI
jgi:antitoxin (DNA-binding transcriptional repressor) of toxin-antitoxin stability system